MWSQKTYQKGINPIRLRSFLSIRIFLLLVFLSGGQVYALPEDVDVPVSGGDYLPAGNGHWYAIRKLGGLYFSSDQGGSWEPRNLGLPARAVYPFVEGEIKDLTSLSICPEDPLRVAVTTSFGLFASSDGGMNFRQVPLRQPLKNTAYVTCSAIDPAGSQIFLIGTSFSGFFETRDSGRSWRNLSENIALLKKGAGFYEEISAAVYVPGGDSIITALGFGKGLFLYNRKDGSYRSLPVPAEGDTVLALWIEPGLAAPSPAAASAAGSAAGAAASVSPAAASASPAANTGAADSAGPAAGTAVTGGNRIYARTAVGVYGADLYDFDWKKVPDYPEPAGFPVPSFSSGKDRREGIEPFCEEAKAARRAAAADKYGIYLNSHNAEGARFERHLDFMQAHGFNSFVLDMKDDDGFVTYGTELALPRSIGAVRRRFDIKEVIRKAHERDIYVIARIVVFKDKQLYGYRGNDLAVWNRRDNVPWGYFVPVTDGETGEITHEQREFWVDPFSAEVWEYNIAIAEELEKLGVDEIQFDYIRFPSDGDLSTAVYRHQRQGMSRIEALESFVVMARERVTLPISTDLYGFNSWYRMGNWIGQNMEMLRDYVDVISPMYYPSHFPSDFLKEYPYLERAEVIYRDGTARAQEIAEGRALIRPYVQAFLIGGELRMESPAYTEYLLRQLKGSAQASGFTLWNASNRYYMVTVPLNEYTGGKN